MTVEPGRVVEVIYALPDRQPIVEVPLEPGMTAAQAVAASGLAEQFPAILAEPLVLGIWGVEVEPDQPLRAGDRVEISRPLVADPREMRRDLMEAGRVMGGAAAPDAGVRKKGEA